jgi:RNA polymerase sigma factor (sigma-70 family)
VSTSDPALLSSWAAGDLQAGDRLFRRHAPAVVRFFRNKISADLEDLVQQTFLRGLEGRDRYRGESSFGGYLIGIAYRVLADYYRARYRVQPALGLDEISLYDLSPSPSLAVAERREHQLLLTALRQLPLMYQVVLELYYWEEMTSRAIAETLEIPHGTAQTRLARGRELLADRVEQLRISVGLPHEQPADLETWAAALRAAL